jgi:hypothetical protein
VSPNSRPPGPSLRTVSPNSRTMSPTPRTASPSPRTVNPSSPRPGPRSQTPGPRSRTAGSAFVLHDRHAINRHAITEPRDQAHRRRFQLPELDVQVHPVPAHPHGPLCEELVAQPVGAASPRRKSTAAASKSCLFCRPIAGALDLSFRACFTAIPAGSCAANRPAEPYGTATTGQESDE